MATSPLSRPRVSGIGALVLTVAALLTGPTAVASAAVPVAPASTTASCPAPSPTPVAGEGVDLTATVLGPAASCGSPGAGNGSGGSSPAGPTGGGSSSGSGTVSGSTNGSVPSDQAVSVSPAANTTAPSADEVDLGGVLNVGGLSSAYIPSLDPFGGDLQLWFTVRNISDSTIDSTADFWMEGIFGNHIASVDGVDLTGLRPGETRTVSAEVPRVGQWTVLTAHARLTPPDTVDGVELSPLVRDSTVFALPWLLVLIVAAGLAAGVVVQLLRRRVVASPAGVPA